MLKNYFKIAWRNLIKSNVYSFINILGLATGMAVAMLIAFWILDEVRCKVITTGRPVLLWIIRVVKEFSFKSCHFICETSTQRKPV